MPHKMLFLKQFFLININNFSIFYVFYEQYLTIWTDTLVSLGLSLAAIFCVTFLVTGRDFHHNSLRNYLAIKFKILSGFDIVSSLTILIMVTLIVTNMGGLMYIWNISLNAVSLVNLVMVCFSTPLDTNNHKF